LIDNIEVRKLSPDEENNILANGKKMQQKGNYFISLNNTKETSPAKSLCGLLILKEGKLIFPDIKTMTGKQRTVSYIPVDDVSDIVQELLKIIENR
jgi:hypothetical protein